MGKYKLILSVLMTLLLFTVAYSQEKQISHQVKTISGTVTTIDFVDNTISIRMDDQHQMSFAVANDASIVRDTHDIGLMDIKEGHPVTIQYDISSPGQEIAHSIVDNKPSAHD